MQGRTAVRHVVTVLVVLVVGCAPAAAQSVQDVVDAMKARYQQQLETVDTYIVETNAYTSYHRKTTRNGETMYETERRWKDGDGSLFSGAGTMPSMQPGPSQLDTLAQTATYVGTETVDDRRCHVLRLDDPAALAGNRMPTMPEDAPPQGKTHIYIDAERYVPLRMVSELTVEQDGTPRTLRPRLRFTDYRTTDGLTLPWMMEMTMENLNATISPEERAQARQSLDEMEARLEQMPEEQRQMMEGMMKSQLEQLRSILEQGSINITVQVQDVRVNTPLPDDVFGEGR